MADYPRIIGLAGPARVGKDTLAKVLTDAGFRRVAFADALKSDILRMLIHAYQKLNLDYSERPTWGWFSDPARKEQMRPLMVEYGRSMRSIDPLYWIKRAQYDYMTDVTQGVVCNRYVITDVRYRNEADWIRRCGGIVVLLERDGVRPANEEETRSLAEVEADAVFREIGADIEKSRAAFREFLRDNKYVNFRRGYACN